MLAQSRSPSSQSMSSDGSIKSSYHSISSASSCSLKQKFGSCPNDLEHMTEVSSYHSIHDSLKLSSEMSNLGHKKHRSSSSLVSKGVYVISKCIENTYRSASSLNSSYEERDEDDKDRDITWLKVAFMFFLSLKLQLLVEHAVCILSLILTRYIAGKKVESLKKEFATPLVRTASAIENSEHRSESVEKLGSYQSKSISSSTLPPSATDMSMKESGHSYDSATSYRSISSSQSFNSLRQYDDQSQDNHKSLHSANSFEKYSTLPNSPSKDTSFLPLDNQANNDDWGQYCGLDDDFDDSFCMGGGIVRNELQSAHIPTDPFQSLNKSIMKKRGKKISVCKLGQLQEEENEDECE